jgi:hypothetical protein
MYCKPKPRMCGVGRFLFHKGIKFLGRVSSFLITLPVQHPGGVGTLITPKGVYLLAMGTFNDLLTLNLNLMANN